MPPQYTTFGHTDYCELKFLRNSRCKDILTSFVSPKAGNEFAMGRHPPYTRKEEGPLMTRDRKFRAKETV